MSLGIYIQVPFCQTKCTYCNFHTGVVSRDRYEPYANAVCREIAESAAGSLGGRTFMSDIKSPVRVRALAPEETPLKVDTVYFGGGTPSLLEPSALAKILATLHTNFPIASSTPEVTLEADPETITPEKSQAWLAAGFNRISLGSQSFNDAELIASGRMHRRADIYNAAKILRAAGFANISLDLIAGLPHQTSATWEQSVTETLAHRPEHISIYMLEVDEGSRLGRESLAGGTRYSAATIPSDDATAEFYESAGARLASAGYDHYEISNWALPGQRSAHNLKYWRREPYLGLGAGAHSFDGHTRWANVHDSAAYVAHIEQGTTAHEQIEAVTRAQALEEEFFLGLRLLEGIDFARIGRDYASNGQRDRVAAIRARIVALREQGVVEFEVGRLRLTPARLTVSNEVLVALLE
jgi:oxygen-independent coproporphyrinogen III oxidase